ncbi:hypothetical protein E1B28_011609 [Marasmius oreades]|uniref:DUF6534 domain-containing protein n=1 Tax=Marasmius oreades TaxID=181124 RepID=A0A9P7UPS2_9AGAR|nr:uncharacterized protein E1B28_011609 [Marasmius oreades]KAG7089987.1 hypothetical protein E1B28_011609 [Marasmius oreades]
MSSSAALPSPSLTGPPIAALSLNCMLFAVLTIQIYSYEVKFPRDRIALKIFVWLVYIMDLTQIVLLHMFCWDVWVTGLAIQGNAPTPQPDTGAHTMMTAIISAMIQGFFAWRVYVLKRDSLIVRITAATIVLLAFTQCISCVCGVSSYYVAGKKASSVALEIELAVFTQIWMIGAVVCDLLIAVSMTWILISYNRASKVKRTRTLVKSLILRSVETGTVTFAFTMVNLILFWIMPQNYIYMVFDRTLSKLYSNALFLSLNARECGADVSTTNWVSDSTPDTTGSVSLDRSRIRFRSDTDEVIHIARHTVTDTENQFDDCQLSNKETLSSV